MGRRARVRVDERWGGSRSVDPRWRQSRTFNGDRGGINGMMDKTSDKAGS